MQIKGSENLRTELTKKWKSLDKYKLQNTGEQVHRDSSWSPKLRTFEGLDAKETSKKILGLFGLEGKQTK